MFYVRRFATGPPFIRRYVGVMRGPDIDIGRGTSGGIRLSSVWVAVALLLPFTISLTSRLLTGDLAYGIRAGQIMLDTGEVLRSDVFSFSAWCRPWLNQQWATDVIFAGAYGTLGWLGLALLRAALSVGVVSCTYLACRTFGAERRAAAWLSLLSWLPHFAGQLRAQFFGMLFFAALLWILAGRTDHPRRVPWAIPLVMIWANTHGSFPFAVLLLFFAVVEDRVAGRRNRRMYLITVLAALATVVTPFGPRVWAYVADLSTHPLIREVVTEWQPPWASLPEGIAFSVAAAIGIVAFARNRRELPWPAWLQLALFMALAASSMRALFFSSIVLAVTLARLPWARRIPREDPRHRTNALLVAVLATLPLVALSRWLPYAGEVPPRGLVQHAPQALTVELRSILRPGEPFANPVTWGSWFELELPNHPVFVDSRFELIPVDALRASLLLTGAGSGWEQTLDGLPVRVLVVNRETQGPLVAALASSSDWRLVYSDAEGLVFGREGGEPPPPLPACSGAPD